MDNFIIELVGMLAGACTTCAFLPQVIKVWKTRSCADISLLMYVVLVTGLAAWVAYGFFRESPSIIIANIVTFVLAGAVLIMKLLWGQNKDSA
ncbi:MAG: SemiSWEET family sugar transporter [Alphaproteobacteria bacterium]|nr:SemiSWEET transporter [Alphaproteobacteria bacterium]